LVGELSLIHSRNVVIRVCAFRTHCCSAALVPMAQASSHWHGRVLHFDANCVLRRQRQEPASVAGASSNRVLVLAKRSRVAVDLICSAAAPVGPGRWSILP
jgi:hypothetical protein